MTLFEDRRFSDGQSWALRSWRITQKIRQVRGRNLRSEKCIGVTIFFSQQFKRFVFHCLPDYLKDSYRGEIPLASCVKETLELLPRYSSQG